MDTKDAKDSSTPQISAATETNKAETPTQPTTDKADGATNSQSGAEGKQYTSGTQQDGNKAPAKPKGFLESLTESPLLIGAVVLMWFLMIRSMRKSKKKQQEHQDKLNSVAKGDKIVTIGGLHGTVVGTTEKTLTLKIDEKTGATITIDRRALHEKATKDVDKA